MRPFDGDGPHGCPLDILEMSDYMEDVLRVGIIGAGLMGSDHARILSRRVANVSVAAVADTNEAAAQALARELDVGTVYSDGLELIDSKEVDAVIVAAPDRLHVIDTLACIERGIPVLCEKPLAPTAAEAAKVVNRHAELPRPLVSVGFMRRFDPGYIAMRDRLRSHTDGALLMSHSIHRNVAAYPGGDSSSTVTNSAVHEIDILTWMTGSPVVSVLWVAGRASSLMRERHDPQLILMKDSNDVLHSIELQVHAQYGYDVRCEMVCERASVELAPVPVLVPESPLIISSDLRRSVAYPVDWRPRFAEAYRAELTAWVNASLSHNIPDGAATVEEALRTTVVAEAVVRSMREGNWVEVPRCEEQEV